jgi:hypothetical protein
VLKSSYGFCSQLFFFILNAVLIAGDLVTLASWKK